MEISADGTGDGAILDSVTASTTFKTKTGSGTVELEFTFNANWAPDWTSPLRIKAIAFLAARLRWARGE